MILEYSADGEAISDFDLEEWEQRFVGAWFEAHKLDHYKFSTENIFFVVQALVSEGKIEYNQVSFRHNGLDLNVNRYGAVPDRPLHFCSTTSRYAERQVIGAFYMKKKYPPTCSLRAHIPPAKGVEQGV